MSLLTTLDALEQAGATAEVILAVVRAHEASREAKADERREKDAARQKAKRIRNGHAESRGHDDGHAESDEPSPHVGERTQVVTPSLPSLRSEEVVVDVVERERGSDWPKGDGPHLAKLLIAEVGSHKLDLNRSGGLNTSTGRFLTWKREGASWVHDVVPVVRTACTKCKTRINSWQFFDDAIAASIAANRAALEIPDGRVVPLRPGGESFADRAAADIAEARRRLLEG